MLMNKIPYKHIITAMLATLTLACGEVTLKRMLQQTQEHLRMVNQPLMLEGLNLSLLYSSRRARSPWVPSRNWRWILRNQPIP